MKPVTEGEKQLVLRRLLRDLARLRIDAGNLGLDFLAFLLAQAQIEVMEGDRPRG